MENGELKITYIGQDLGYLKKLKNVFADQYPGISLSYDHVANKEESDLKPILLNVARKKPDCILVDFELHTTHMLSLARDLNEETLTKKSLVIGLCGNDSKDETLSKSMSLGIKINHVKSMEVLDVVYHMAIYLFPQQALSIEYATATTRKELIAKTIFRAGFATSDYLHFETSYPFEVNQEFQLHSKVFKQVPKPNRYKVLRVGQNNLYYPFKYWVDASYELIPEEDREKAERRLIEYEIKKEIADRGIKEGQEVAALRLDLIDKKNRFAHTREDLKAAMERFINKHKAQNQAKRTRVLVIDRDLRILNEAGEDLRQGEFSLRYFTHLQAGCAEIERIRPGIILFQYERKDQIDDHGKLAFPPNDLEALSYILGKISAIEGYTPFLILFNCTLKTDQLKEQSGLSNIATLKDDMSMDLLEKLVSSYESKDGRNRSHDPRKSFDAKENRLYFSKKSAESILEYDEEIALLKMTESELYFESKEAIPMGTCFYITDPTHMYFTTVEVDANSRNSISFDGHLNRGLIHGVGEIEKGEVRRFVNSLFFDEIREKREAEIADFKRKNAEAAAQKADQKSD